MSSPADELRAAASTLRQTRFTGAMTATPAVAAIIRAREPLAHLLDLEETYLVGMPDNERLAHVRAALAVARAINGGQP